MPIFIASALKALMDPKVLVGVAFAAVLAFAGLQTARLDHAKGDLTAARTQVATYQAVEKAALTRAKAVQTAQAKVSTQVGAETVAAVQHVQTVTRTIIKEVPTYVSAQAAARCVVPVGFVRLHDAAAAGVSLPAVAQGAGGPLEAPSGVGLDTVASTVAGNYGACHEALTEARAWRTWYAAQALAAAPPAAPAH